MTRPVTQLQRFQIHCHHCKQWLGESSVVMRCVGLFESPRDREHVDGPRDSWHCKKCGWVTVFRPAENEARPNDWRQVEAKRA